VTDGRTDGQTVGRSDGQTESIIAKTALCIASYADALSKINTLYRHAKTLSQCTVCESKGDGAVCDLLQFIVQNFLFSFVDSDKCRLNK